MSSSILGAFILPAAWGKKSMECPLRPTDDPSPMLASQPPAAGGLMRFFAYLAGQLAGILVCLISGMLVSSRLFLNFLIDDGYFLLTRFLDSGYTVPENGLGFWG